MRPPTRLLAAGIVVVVVQGLFLLVVYMASTLSAFHELRRWESGDGTFALAVVEHRPYLDLFGWHVRSSIVVGHSGAVPGYGHPKAYSFIHGIPDPDHYLKGCAVEWSEAGVTFTEPAGHRLFFPRAVYASGR